MNANCTKLRFRVPRGEIGYVRFVLEAYEGLAQIESAPGRDEVTWVVPDDRVGEALELAAALEGEIDLHLIGSLS